MKSESLSLFLQVLNRGGLVIQGGFSKFLFPVSAEQLLSKQQRIIGVPPGQPDHLQLLIDMLEKNEVKDRLKNVDRSRSENCWF